jgi:predicted TIM-barrel fold metal-dependent hydrolase
VIDIHTHLWDWQNDTPSFISEYMLSRGYFGEQSPESFFNVKALLDALDEAEIQSAALHPLRSESYGWVVSNQYIAEQVAQAPDRLIGFAGVSPMRHDATNELREGIERYKLQGLKLHPPMQMFHPADPACFPIYEMMQDYGLPILFHTGSGPTQLSDRYSNPHLVDEVAVHFPDLKIINLSATVGKALGYGLMLVLLVAVKEVVGDLKRVLFASDYPWYTPRRMLDLLHQAQTASLVLPEPLQITKQDVADITGENAERILGIG